MMDQFAGRPPWATTSLANSVPRLPCVGKLLPVQSLFNGWIERLGGQVSRCRIARERRSPRFMCQPDPRSRGDFRSS